MSTLTATLSGNAPEAAAATTLLTPSTTSILTVVIPALKPPLTGRAAAEAQALGRPVVVNAVGVLPENIITPPRMAEELRTGWVVRPGHAGDLARGIASALSLDRKTYDAMGARARQFAEFMFSPQSVAAKVRGLYTSLLAR